MSGRCGVSRAGQFTMRQWGRRVNRAAATCKRKNRTARFFRVGSRGSLAGMLVVIDVGTNIIDEALFQGFLCASPDAPKGLQGCALERTEGQSPRMVVTFGQDVTEGGVAELLRVLGGSAKGDDAMRVLEPAQYVGREAMPMDPPGARRWPCPRCSKTVIEGKNAEPGFNGGLCMDCAAVDRKLAGGRVGGQTLPVQAPTSVPGVVGTPTQVQVQVPAHLRRPAEKPTADLPPPTIMHPLPIIDGVAALQFITPQAPTIAFVADRQVLAFWTGQGWRIIDGIPPVVL